MKAKPAAVLLILGLACAAHPAFADACSAKNHTSGTVGALLDGLAANAVARDMDCEDQPYAARAYDQSFREPVGRRYKWSHGRNRGYVVNDREYYRGPRFCRDFTQVVYRRGREFPSAGTACRKQNGAWEFL
jgi:surface antigen